MKRVGFLYDKVMDYDNIVLAMEKYDANRPCNRRRGVDYRLAHEILGEMKTDYAKIIGKPRLKTIKESGKERQLQIPNYKSCIAQIALWNVCGKYVERRIHNQSFSSRKGMGGHLAARKCERFVHTNAEGKAKYFLYFDIRKYYQHINKRVLVNRLETIFKDKKIIELFKAVIYSSDNGLPIGYPFSHALANLFLAPLYYLIKSIKSVSKIFVYMDNWIIFSRYKKSLKKSLQTARSWLEELGCEVKDDWQIAPTANRGVKLCGFIIHANKATRLYHRIWHRIVRNFDRCMSNPNCERLKLSMASRLGWLKAINKQYSKIFVINKKQGGYLWK